MTPSTSLCGSVAGAHCSRSEDALGIMPSLAPWGGNGPGPRSSRGLAGEVVPYFSSPRACHLGTRSVARESPSSIFEKCGGNEGHGPVSHGAEPRLRPSIFGWYPAGDGRRTIRGFTLAAQPPAGAAPWTIVINRESGPSTMAPWAQPSPVVHGGAVPRPGIEGPRLHFKFHDYPCHGPWQARGWFKGTGGLGGRRACSKNAMAHLPKNSAVSFPWNRARYHFPENRMSNHRGLING